MKKEIVMPKIGLDMEEGTIESWEKKVGDPVKVDDVIAVIETDKVFVVLPLFPFIRSALM